jgi:3-oxoacyl-[acyl-carrier protein] reductase
MDGGASLGLRDKTVLLTGAGGGIGRATAALLSDLGTRLALADVTPGAAQSVCDDLGGAGRHIALTFDLGDPEAAAEAVQKVVASFGVLDVVINAGATLRRRTLDQLTVADVGAMIAVNLVGPLFLARAAAQHMASRASGRMIFFSSQSAFTGGYIGATPYAMTKAAVVAMVKSLARELAPSGICVNAIAPGGIDTPMLRDGADPVALERFRQLIPAGRFGSANEVAMACAFLASDWASYINGHTLDVNGGQLMR